MAFLDVPANIVALRDAVKLRFSLVTLKQLTNDGHIDPTTATVQDAKIDIAVKDAASEFENISGTEPDLEDESHINAICQGVLAALYSYKGSSAEFHKEHRFRFLSQAQKVRETSVTAPGNTSRLDVFDETVGTNGPVYPDMNRRNLTNYLPNKSLRGRRGFGDRLDNF